MICRRYHTAFCDRLPDKMNPFASFPDLKSGPAQAMLNRAGGEEQSWRATGINDRAPATAAAQMTGKGTGD